VWHILSQSVSLFVIFLVCLCCCVDVAYVLFVSDSDTGDTRKYKNNPYLICRQERCKINISQAAKEALKHLDSFVVTNGAAGLIICLSVRLSLHIVMYCTLGYVCKFGHIPSEINFRGL